MADRHTTGKPSGGNENNTSPRERDESSAPRAVTQALRKEGGAGGVSGTGQAFPHHGFDDSAGKEALGNPAGDEASLSDPDTGGTYQTGGTHVNRDRQERTRKDRLAGSTVASKWTGGMDPAPGAPVHRDEG